MKKFKTTRATDDMPEIDFSRCTVVRRGPRTDRRFSLALLRGSQDLSQAQLAKKAKLTQSEISRAELRNDCLVSTLERYAKALGGELALTIKIDGRRYPITLE